jgi:CRP-like cAMP-binding protein
VARISQEFIRNRLLRALARPDFAVLQDVLEPVPLDTRQVIAAPDEPIQTVYFPEAGIISILTITGDGRKLEAGLYGREGTSATPLALGVDRTPHQHVVQVPGAALRMGAAELRQAFEERPAIRALLLRYVQAVAVQTSFTAHANGAYTINQRLARWLLMCDDRSDDGIHLTHEFLGQMLGVRRSSVTLALHTVESEGLIRAVRGHITVLDRAGLKRLAGDSYGVPEAEYFRIIGR